MSNIRSIVKKHLEDNGFDGLYNWDDECACKLDDLMPCDRAYQECEAGYLVEFDGECPCGQGCDYHIQKNKPAGGPGGVAHPDPTPEETP